ncbi:MAG: penicillin-binding protein 2 [Chloroflexi bacterium]|nr:penicillin-binding protein 2 [Chloroflexota bacterium]
MRGQGGAPRIGGSIMRVALALLVMYAGLAGGLTYWQVVQAQELTEAPGNPLTLAASRTEPRGRILDSRGTVLARNIEGEDGLPRREYSFLATTPIIGYKSVRFGATGLESTYDAEMVGLGRSSPAERLLRKFRSDPYDPQDLVLSIDARLQGRAFDLLGGDRGAVVAIEPATGRVLAMVSAPTFNANLIVDPARAEAAFAQLNEDPPEASRLLNRATQGRYTPGSVFKIVTAIAAVGSGAVDADTVYEEQPAAEEDGLRVEGFRIRDGHHTFTGNEALNFVEATEVSCNIYFALAGLATGEDDLFEWSRRLGFGSRIPFELPTAPSFVSGGTQAEDGFDDSVELASAAYGQGETFVTPLQMALVAQAVANDGQLMKPKLVDELRAESGSVRTLSPESLSRVTSASQAALIQEAMQAAVEGEFGEDFAGAAKVPGVPTAGKSGTAELGGEGEPHSWFIGFAPVEEPQIAVAVIVERAGFGRERAVPLAGQLMETYLDLAE